MALVFVLLASSGAASHLLLATSRTRAIVPKIDCNEMAEDASHLQKTILSDHNRYLNALTDPQRRKYAEQIYRDIVSKDPDVQICNEADEIYHSTEVVILTHEAILRNEAKKLESILAFASPNDEIGKVDAYDILLRSYDLDHEFAKKVDTQQAYLLQALADTARASGDLTRANIYQEAVAGYHA